MWKWILKVFFLAVVGKQKARWGEFTDLGLLIQNSGFNVLSRMHGTCPNSLLGWLFETESQQWLYNKPSGEARLSCVVLRKVSADSGKWEC